VDWGTVCRCNLELTCGLQDLAIVDAFKFFVDTHSSGGKINSQILTQEPYQNIRKHFEKVYIPELAVHH